MKKCFVFLSMAMILAGVLFALSAECCQATTKVVVPRGNPIVIDGIFSKGEWDDALKLPISENYHIYLKVYSDTLAIGLKSAKPIGMLLTEIYITSNEKEFYNLHSSAALGEGIIPFPSDLKSLKFSVNNNSHWEASCDVIDKVEEEKWIAAGKPNDREKYDKIFKRKDGKEYKIELNKFSGTRLKISVGLRDAYEAAHFPDNFDFKSWENWLELVLPEGKSVEDQEAEKQKIAVPDNHISPRVDRWRFEINCF